MHGPAHKSMKTCYILFLELWYLSAINATAADNQYCDKNQYGDCHAEPYVSHFDVEHADTSGRKSTELDASAGPPVDGPAEIFLLYDVNQSEGFNLRRDVYIRMAVFLNILRERDGYRNATLVLPPFHRLYHWKSRDRADDILFWNHFFNLDSLKGFANVIDLWEYFDRVKAISERGAQQQAIVPIDHVIQLKHFASMFESGKFVDKFHFGQCTDDDRRKQNDKFHFVYTNFSMTNFHCVEFQGSASLLHDVLEELPRTGNAHFSVAILNAETVLHDRWGDREFWRARISMRFNADLVRVANEYQRQSFNYIPEQRNTHPPPYDSTTQGGNYVCAHLRRADFLYGREKTTPSLRSAAEQIKAALRRFDLRDVFISSDCTGAEYMELKSNLKRYRVTRFTPATKEQRSQLRDGGIAIVDQVVCSYARYFIGTYESTFTYRIYEEREILGFPKENTFNTFCKYSDDAACSQNPMWPIVH